MEPYKWLGAGAVALGLGAAVASGSGIAYADDGTGSGQASASPDLGGAVTPGGGSESSDAGMPSAPPSPPSSTVSATGGNTDSTSSTGSTSSGAKKTKPSSKHRTARSAPKIAKLATPAGGTTSAANASSAKAVFASPSGSDAPVEPARAIETFAVRSTQTAITTALATPAPLTENPVTTVVSGVLALAGLNTGTPAGPQVPVTPTPLTDLVVAAYRAVDELRIQATGAAPTQTTSRLMATPQVTAVTATQPREIAAVPVGNGIPYTVVTSPTGDRTYVVTTSMSSTGGLPTSTVVGINTATNRPVGDPVSIGYVPTSGFMSSAKPIAFSPDGTRVYVSSVTQSPTTGAISGSTTVIDAATGNVVGDPIPLGNVMTPGLVVSPDGRRLYAANSDGTVSVFDLQHGNAMIGTPIPIGTVWGPQVAFGPSPDIVITKNDAQTVYITDWAEKSVFVLDPTTNEVSQTAIPIDGSPVSIALAPDNRHLIVNSLKFQNPGGFDPSNQASLTVIDTATNSVVGSPISYGAVSQAPATNGLMAVSPDGRYVYTDSVVTNQGGTPSLLPLKIDTVTGAVQAISPSSSLYPSSFALSPDGTRLYVPSIAAVNNQPQTSVVVINTSTNTVLTTIPVDAGAPTALALSADGSRLYLGEVTAADPQDISTARGQITVIDTATSNPVTPPVRVNPITVVLRRVTTTVAAVMGDFTRGLGAMVSTTSSDLNRARSDVEQFLHDLNNGLTLAGLVDDVANLLENGAKPLPKIGILGIGSFFFGIRDMIAGHASNDPGQELNGLIDAGSAVAGIVSPQISIAAQLAKLYASFWVPIGNQEQTNFLNFISQCVAHKNLDQLSPSQSQQVIDHYGGLFGLANLMSDYSRYKTRGFAGFFGQTGCP